MIYIFYEPASKLAIFTTTLVRPITLFYMSYKAIAEFDRKILRQAGDPPREAGSSLVDRAFILRAYILSFLFLP